MSPGLPLPRDTEAASGGAELLLLPVGISDCFLKRARINGTVGIQSGKPGTSSARLSKARLCWDRRWRTPRTCHYPLRRASRYLLGFVHPFRLAFPWDSSGSCFPFGARAEDELGAHTDQTPLHCPGACAREGWQCQLPFLPCHALLGLRIPDPECSHPIPPAAPGACGRDSSNEASNAPSYSASATVTAEVTSFQDIWPCPQPPPAQCHPQPLPSSASHPLLPSLCSWMDQLLPLPSPTASPTACSDIQALFNVCFASRKRSLVAGDGEGTT